MTQYLLSVILDEDEMAATTPDQMQQVVEQVDTFNAAVQAAGAWVFAGGLEPRSTATVVRVADGEATITDGPYTESKEHLGGFWVIEAADLDAALDWARRGSGACGAAVEVRPFQPV
jgi:hypothetical protein